jgi:formate hydrogenlyase subunit 3/multisubunit Na+/H+ antiporter MnhD subunit
MTGTNMEKFIPLSAPGVLLACILIACSYLSGYHVVRYGMHHYGARSKSKLKLFSESNTVQWRMAITVTICIATALGLHVGPFQVATNHQGNVSDEIKRLIDISSV